MARSRVRPESSSATIVLSNVGSSDRSAIPATSASCSAIPTSKAGRKCLTSIRANGGNSHGRSLAVKNGLSMFDAEGSAATRASLMASWVTRTVTGSGAVSSRRSAGPAGLVSATAFRHSTASPTSSSPYDATFRHSTASPRDDLGCFCHRR